MILGLEDNDDQRKDDDNDDDYEESDDQTALGGCLMAQAGGQPGRQPFNQLFLSATTIPATTATATGGQLIVGIKVRWASITFGDLLWASKYSAHPLKGIIW